MLHGFCLGGETFNGLFKRLIVYEEEIANMTKTPDYNYKKAIGI